MSFSFKTTNTQETFDILEKSGIDYVAFDINMELVEIECDTLSDCQRLSEMCPSAPST